MNWQKLVDVTEVTVLASVGSFFGSLAAIPGASFDGAHIKAAGVAALVPLAYKLAAVVQSFTATQVPAGPVVPVAADPGPSAMMVAPAAEAPRVDVVPAVTVVRP